MFTRKPPITSRKQLMDIYIDRYVRHGYHIETVYGWDVVMVRGKKVNHVLHFLLGFVTFFLWWIVWFLLAVTTRYKRVKIHVGYYFDVKVTGLR